MGGYGGGGGARWNDETQSWESGGTVSGPVGGAGGGPVVPPPPPPPEYAPDEAPGRAIPEYVSTDAPAHPPVHPPAHVPVYVPEAGGWRTPVPGAPAPEARTRSRTVVAAGVAAAVLVAGSAGGWLLWRGDGDEKPPAAGGSSASVPAPPESTDPTGTGSGDPTGSDPTSESPSPSDGTTPPTDDVPPPGYRAVEDLKGFTVAVPEGWDRTESGQSVFYNAPDGRSLLQVFVVTEAGLTPYEALRGASEDGRANKPGYQEISLERVTGEAGAPADSAELVYAYDRADGSRRKVVDRAFTAADGTHYAILAAGPESAWPKQREVLRVALDFFRPGAH
ncbi:serine/arginine repetitive matrix protein 2 [Streptomyces sp. c-19]|uniref:serine/arginine repetitive matrix protein 2 n=1 Tax=Streptomyces sp. c-19 TaxID=2789275 RepID=UPI0039815B4D